MDEVTLEETRIALGQNGRENIELLRRSGKYGLDSRDLKFANSLIEQLDRTLGLTLKQWYWVKELADHCTKSISDYGHRTGKCRFCRRTLTDKLSVKLGYGPICAKKYHLPH